MDDQVCDFFRDISEFCMLDYILKILIKHLFGCWGEKNSEAQVNGSSISCEEGPFQIHWWIVSFALLINLSIVDYFIGLVDNLSIVEWAIALLLIFSW